MKTRCVTENFLIVIGFAATFIMLGSMFLESSGEAYEPQYAIIENDYAGEVVTDRETNIRYLRTDGDVCY